MIYPNGRKLKYQYNPGADDSCSRISSIADDAPSAAATTVSTTLASFRYLGAGQIVQSDYPEPAIRCDYDAEWPGSLKGLDRFGRVTDLRWWRTSDGADLERIRHGYDRAGNRLWRECPVAKASGKDFDEFYTYDRLDQLRTFARGRLNADRTGLRPKTKTFVQGWGLDATGNWSTFAEGSDDRPGWSQTQTRTANTANEITGANGLPAPSYDAAGNMLAIPSPTEITSGGILAGGYDAWNRLVRLITAVAVKGQYAYDGAGRRITKDVAVTSGGAIGALQHDYTAGQQLIETRYSRTSGVGGQLTTMLHQNVWSPLYIDAPILRDSRADGVAEASARTYYIADAKHNVTALSNAVGEAVERYTYDAYGAATPRTNGWECALMAPLDSNTTLYSGRICDLESGLLYYRARYHSPQAGLFLSRDPLSYFAGDINLYRFVQSEPISHVDPYGTTCSCSGGAWTFVGSVGEGAIIIGRSSATITARCDQAEARAWRQYDCRGVCFEAKVYCYCEVVADVVTYSIGVQVGVDWSKIAGRAYGATDQEMATGLAAGITLFILQLQGGADLSWGHQVGGGAGLGTSGIGLGIAINHSFVTVKSSGTSCRRGPLTWAESAITRQYGPCKSHDVRISHPKAEINPFTTPAWL